MKKNDPIKHHHDARASVPRWEHYIHLAYFALVAIGGPYHYGAMACLLIGILSVALVRD